MDPTQTIRQKKQVVSLAVVLATYNGERFIADQIKSILNQSESPDLLLISDDSSIDRTVPILDQLLKRSSLRYRIVLKEKRMGYARNFQTAVEYVDEDWILFCDQDDVWKPHKIELLREHLSLTNNLVVLHDLDFCSEDLELLEGSLHARLKERNLSIENFENGCCMAVRTDFAKLVLPSMPTSSAHDTWLSKAALACDKRGFFAEKLIFYRVHPGQTSGALTKSLSPKVGNLVRCGNEFVARFSPSQGIRKLRRILLFLSRRREQLRLELDQVERLLPIVDEFGSHGCRISLEAELETLRRRCETYTLGLTRKVCVMLKEVRLRRTPKKQLTIDCLSYFVSQK